MAGILARSNIPKLRFIDCVEGHGDVLAARELTQPEHHVQEVSVDFFQNLEFGFHSSILPIKGFAKDC